MREALARCIAPGTRSSNREVAIKILPDALAQDPDRLSRFERGHGSILVRREQFLPTLQLTCGRSRHYLTTSLTGTPNVDESCERFNIMARQRRRKPPGAKATASKTLNSAEYHACG